MQEPGMTGQSRRDLQEGQEIIYTGRTIEDLIGLVDRIGGVVFITQTSPVYLDQSLQTRTELNGQSAGAGLLETTPHEAQKNCHDR
jgi:hypothetical protein